MQLHQSPSLHPCPKRVLNKLQISRPLPESPEALSQGLDQKRALTRAVQAREPCDPDSLSCQERWACLPLMGCDPRPSEEMKWGTVEWSGPASTCSFSKTKALTWSLCGATVTPSLGTSPGSGPSLPGSQQGLGLPVSPQPLWSFQSALPSPSSGVSQRSWGLGCLDTQPGDFLLPVAEVPGV